MGVKNIFRWQYSPYPAGQRASNYKLSPALKPGLGTDGPKIYVQAHPLNQAWAKPGPSMWWAGLDGLV